MIVQGASINTQRDCMELKTDRNYYFSLYSTCREYHLDFQEAELTILLPVGLVEIKEYGEGGIYLVPI